MTNPTAPPSSTVVGDDVRISAGDSIGSIYRLMIDPTSIVRFEVMPFG